MKTTVTITQEHLHKQAARDCMRCAVALALREVLKPEFAPFVAVDGFVVVRPNGPPVYEETLPGIVGQFIRRADGRLSRPLAEAMLPLTFTVNIPDSYRAEVPNAQ